MMMRTIVGEMRRNNSRKRDAESFAKYVSELNLGIFSYDNGKKADFPGTIVLRRNGSDESAEVYNAGRLEIAKTGIRDHDGNVMPEKYCGYARKLGEIRQAARNKIEKALREAPGEVKAIGLAVVPVDTLEDDYYKMRHSAISEKQSIRDQKHSA